jgi:hypothetical protein
VKDKLGKSGNFSGFLFSFEKIYFVWDRKNLRLFCPIENCHGTRIFGSTKTLIQHFQKFHQEKLISCEKCATKFSLLRDLKYHQKRFCPFREKSSALESSCKNSNEHVKKLAKTNPSRQTGELTRNATFVLNLTAVSKHLLTPLAKKYTILIKYNDFFY